MRLSFVKQNSRLFSGVNFFVCLIPAVLRGVSYILVAMLKAGLLGRQKSVSVDHYVYIILDTD